MIVLGILQMSMYQDDPSIPDDYSVFLTRIGSLYMSYHLDIIDTIETETIGDCGGPLEFHDLFYIPSEIAKYGTA